MKETIVALATPPGISGLAVIRLSGNDAISITDICFQGKSKLFEAKSHTIHYGKIIDRNNLIDTVTVAVFLEPNSYTGENSVEITCHGGSIVANEIINLLIKHGSRLAEPGEFTKRAFLNNKLDLAEVEAIADIIHSVSVQGCHTAARQLSGEFTARLNQLRDKIIKIASHLELELDFSDEDITFVNRETTIQTIIEAIEFCKSLSESFKASEILRSGYFVTILGYPNSGKSTLFNTLLSRKRAIVSKIPGTTRDYLEELIYINGIAIKLIDTAGIRDTKDTIEIEGIEMAESMIKESNLIIILNDVSKSPENSFPLLETMKKKYPDNDYLYVQNKVDLLIESIVDKTGDFISISAKHSIGIDELKQKIGQMSLKDIERVEDVLVNQRHANLLNQAENELNCALDAMNNKYENEIISIHIRKSAQFLGEITGESWNEEILNNIFSKFCIGK